jgi:hypothetical protein
MLHPNSGYAMMDSGSQIEILQILPFVDDVVFVYREISPLTIVSIQSYIEQNFFDRSSASSEPSSTSSVEN